MFKPVRITFISSLRVLCNTAALQTLYEYVCMYILIIFKTYIFYIFAIFTFSLCQIKTIPSRSLASYVHMYYICGRVPVPVPIPNLYIIKKSIHTLYLLPT